MRAPEDHEEWLVAVLAEVGEDLPFEFEGEGEEGGEPSRGWGGRGRHGSRDGGGVEGEFLWYAGLWFVSIC